MLCTAPFSHLKWRSDDFLLWKVLDSRSVLDYFYLSPFFDDSDACINQARRLGNSAANRDEWVGFEYKLIHSCDNGQGVVPIPLGSPFNHNQQFATFVIQKFKLNKGRITPLDCFYIIGGTVYAAPSMGDVLRYRLLHAMELRLEYIHTLNDLVNWNALEGHSFGNILTNSVTTDANLNVKKTIVYEDSEAVLNVIGEGRTIVQFERHVNDHYQQKIAPLIELALPLPPGETSDPTSPYQKIGTTIAHDRFNSLKQDLSLENDEFFFNQLRQRLYNEYMSKQANEKSSQDTTAVENEPSSHVTEIE